MYYQKTCEYCGKQFTAQKSSTRFCSKSCADRANKERIRKWTQTVVETKDRIETIQNSQSFGDILSPRTLALYLGVSLRTAYRYLENGMIPAITTTRRLSSDARTWTSSSTLHHPIVIGTMTEKGKRRQILRS